MFGNKKIFPFPFFLNKTRRRNCYVASCIIVLSHHHSIEIQQSQTMLKVGLKIQSLLLKFLKKQKKGEVTKLVYPTSIFFTHLFTRVRKHARNSKKTAKLAPSMLNITISI